MSALDSYCLWTRKTCVHHGTEIGCEVCKHNPLTKMPKEEKDTKLALGDPKWIKICQPLFVFLQVRRSWPELLQWAERSRVTGNMLRNQLAWLEQFGLAREQQGIWFATTGRYTS